MYLGFKFYVKDQVMRFIVVVSGLFLFPIIVLSHHSRIGYVDERQEVRGEIVDVIWRNPHIRFTLNVVNEAGKNELWKIEGFGSIYALHRTGITEELFNTGDQVIMVGQRSNHQPQEFLASHVLLANGTEAVLQANGEPYWGGEILGGRAQWEADETEAVNAAHENRGLFRVWSIPALADRVMHSPFTESAIAARAIWDPLDNFAARCEPEGMPRIMINPHPFEFVDRGVTILLRVELYDQVRTIHMPGSEVEVVPASPLGYSVGHWEGNTLVVETTKINWAYFDNIGTPQSDFVEMIERFTLSDDQSHLNYRLTITDPATFAEPATIMGHWLALGEEITPFACEVY